MNSCCCGYDGVWFIKPNDRYHHLYGEYMVLLRRVLRHASSHVMLWCLVIMLHYNRKHLHKYFRAFRWGRPQWLNIIWKCSTTLTFLNQIFWTNPSPSSMDGSWIATDWSTSGTCHWRHPISRSQFSYHLLRMEKGFSEIFGLNCECCWTVSNYLWCLLPTHIQTFIHN